MKNQKGFTLVELLVVIAIIGILSTVAVVNLNSARGKARKASVQGNLAGMVPAVVLCNDDALQIQADDGASAGTSSAIVLCSGTEIPIEGHKLCTGGGVWPTLPTGWTYNACSHNATLGTFSYSADDTVNTVSCDEDGCTTT